MFTNNLQTKFISFTSILFFMMLVFPYQYLGVKVFFIVIIVLAFFINGGFVTLIPKYQKWILIFLGMNMIYSIYGLVLNNPGVNHYLLLFIAWPILYFIFCSFVNREAINKLFKVSFSELFKLPGSKIKALDSSSYNT